MQDLLQDVRTIEATTDPLERTLLLAGLVTRLFREAGWPLVVVGGSAIEFFTEGRYLSGDLDLCRSTAAAIPLRQAQDLMGRLGATGGPRSWRVAGLFVDLLGWFENEAATPCRVMQTPFGAITLMPAELAVVERVLMAFYPAPSAEARGIAKQLLAACLTNVTPVDWREIERLSNLPAFNIARELAALKDEVRRELPAPA